MPGRENLMSEKIWTYFSLKFLCLKLHRVVFIKPCLPIDIVYIFVIII